MEQNKRIVYYDVLNIMAAIAVVALHMNGIVHNVDLVGTGKWTSSLIFECLFYWAVPIFVMLTGAKLMRYREKYDTKTFFKKRFTKIAIPLVFWAAICFIPYIRNNKNMLLQQGILQKNQWILNSFLGNKEQYIYYFMFEILGVYLTMPLLSLLNKKEYRKTLWITCILFFIFNGTLPCILKLFGIEWNTAFSIRINGYLIYAILGYLLSTEELSKEKKRIIYTGAIIGLIYRYITTLLLSKSIHFLDGASGGYFEWHCILLSMAVFIFIKDLKIDEKLDCTSLEDEKKIKRNNKIKKVLSEVSGCSFGIYLTHVLIKNQLTKILALDITSLGYRTIGILVVYLASLVFVYILKRLPLLKKVVP